MADKNTIKNWFKTGFKPTQAQFWETWDSFWHKDEQIPVDKIEGLEGLLNDKADADLVNQIKKPGRYLISRGDQMFFADEPEEGDTVTGIVEGQYLNAGTYYGGDFNLLESYIDPANPQEPNDGGGDNATNQNSGQFLINRNGQMFFSNEPQVGDTVIGTVEGQFLNAGTFYGGDPNLLSNYQEQIEENNLEENEEPTAPPTQTL